MNERKWTKGPWNASMGDTDVYNLDHKHWFVITQANEPFEAVALTWMDGVEEYEDFADPDTNIDASDAHLIAAAPELYEALEEMLADGEKYVDAIDMAESLRTAIRKAAAALAKARGEA